MRYILVLLSLVLFTPFIIAFPIYCKDLGKEIDRKTKSLLVINAEIIELEKNYLSNLKTIEKKQNIFRNELGTIDKFSNLYAARCKK